MDIDILDNVLESLLFVSGDELKIADICELLEVQKSEINASIKRLQKKYGGKCGIQLLSFNGKLQLASNAEYADIIARVLNPIREKALSSSVMETLSIIAYRQPVTRLEIQSIRGVNCDHAIQVLIDNKLIEVVGRKESIGHPLLFGTTDEFLKRFAIEEVSDLPGHSDLLQKIKELEDVSEPSEQEAEQLYNYDNNAPDFLKGEEVAIIEADEPIAEVAAEKSE